MNVRRGKKLHIRNHEKKEGKHETRETKYSVIAVVKAYLVKWFDHSSNTLQSNFRRRRVHHSSILVSYCTGFKNISISLFYCSTATGR